jgi:phospholipid/cholesterol/gamma-HCH transport system substrate-binding protein
MKLSKEFVIGVVVVVAIAVLYMGVNYLKGINLLSKQLKFYAKYENVAGLTPSNAVVLNGYKIGIVSEVGMNPNGDGSLIVEVVLNDSKLKVPADTKLEIFDADLFGGKGIRILMGDSAVLANHKDTLIGSVSLGLTETIKNEIEPLKQKTSDLFAGLDSVIASLNGVLGSANDKEGLSQVFKNLKNTLQNLDNSTAKVDALLGENAGKLSNIFSSVESISSNIEKNNAQLSNAIKNFSSLSDTLAKLELASTVIKVNRALENFNGVMSKVNEGNGTLGQLVNNDSLHTQLVSASKSLDLLLDDMKTHPKRYVHFSVFGRKDDGGLSKKEQEDVRTILKESK